MYTIGLGKLRHAAWSYLHDVVQNIENTKIKIEVKTKPYKDDTELPARRAIDIESAGEAIALRLQKIFPEKHTYKDKIESAAKTLAQSKQVGDIVNKLFIIGDLVSVILGEWRVEQDNIVGIVPTYTGHGILFEATVDEERNKVFLHWDTEKISKNLLTAASTLAQHLRDQSRQPSVIEYLIFHLSYYDLSKGGHGNQSYARGMGTPGFRPDSQTYMSLTDPGEGHVLAATRFNDWMKGAIVHNEHVERPGNQARQIIESYRLPSLYDFARVRLHVGAKAPTTLYVGRCIKDSGNFEDDFLKLVNTMAGTVSYAFSHGAAECKLSMEGLSTSQAVKFMLGMRGQVQRKRKQVMSAAWNLNQVITDDYDQEPKSLTQRMDIARRAIEITLNGGFDKVTWDGASDTYPSKCVMYQLTYEEALTLVHEAHQQGLLTYFSAGFKFDDIKFAVYTGVDGIGVGGAQVLRHMDRSTGMHGPYMQENIPTILGNRDTAEDSFRGRGVKLLSRLDTMFYEGSISRSQDTLRKDLFLALKGLEQPKIESLISRCNDVVTIEDEGNHPFMGIAKRLINAPNPILKEYFESESDWNRFIAHLKMLVAARNERESCEEYDCDPWLTARKKCRKAHRMSAKAWRRASFQIYDAIED